MSVTEGGPIFDDGRVDNDMISGQSFPGQHLEQHESFHDTDFSLTLHNQPALNPLSDDIALAPEYVQARARYYMETYDTKTCKALSMARAAKKTATLIGNGFKYIKDTFMDFSGFKTYGLPLQNEISTYSLKDDDLCPCGSSKTYSNCHGK